MRILYFFVGDELTISGTSISESTGALVDSQVGLDLRAGPSGAEILVLQGRPIGEPVAQYGPFVMNTEDEIRQTFADYRAHELRRLAVGSGRSGPPRERGSLRPPRGRTHREAARLDAVGLQSPRRHTCRFDRSTRPRRYAAWPTCIIVSSATLISRTPAVTGGSQRVSTTRSSSSSSTPRR